MGFLQGYKTYLAAVGLFGLAAYQLSQGQMELATQSFLGGLAALGLGAKVERLIKETKA
jgi:hypothetical protein